MKRDGGGLCPLRPYQAEAGRAILRSVLEVRGEVITVEMARQGGKNELSAQLEVLLLVLNAARGGNIVKASPTFRPQAITSLQRLRDRLGDAGLARLWRSEHGHIVRLGRARAIFLSAEEQAHVVGATAHHLLEVDEAQDVDKEKFAKEFRPMGAATNVTTVMYGTAWDRTTLLEEAKQRNLELERRDGVRRHFQYDWQEIARFVPEYGVYAEAERARLGSSHPVWLTQYELRALSGGGGFFSEQQLAQLQGEHERRHRRGEGCYVAGVDLAGEDEEAQDAVLRTLRPAKDSTVATIAELSFEEVVAGLPPLVRLRIVEHFYRTGLRHAALYQQLVDVLRNVWRCKRVVVDATGVGQAVAGFLREAMGSAVVPFVFSGASKSELAYALLAAINSGGLKMYRDDGSEEWREFWAQCQHARYELRPNKAMNFYVEPSQGHDDFLISAALVVAAGNLCRPRSARGRAAD